MTGLESLVAEPFVTRSDGKRFLAVAGVCPNGCGKTLYLGAGGHVTCSWIECRNPAAADELLAEVRVMQGWDYEDVYDGPWYVFREPRDEHRLAIKSGHFTILTVGDYFDGGGPVEERLQWICDRVNASMEPTP